MEPLDAVAGLLQSRSDELRELSNATDSPALQETFLNRIEAMNAEIVQAEKLMTAFALEEPGVAVHDVVIAMQRAKLSIQLAVEIRDRVVEAYREISSMQV